MKSRILVRRLAVLAFLPQWWEPYQWENPWVFELIKGFLTNEAKHDVTIIRRIKGILTNKAPNYMDNHAPGPDYEAFWA